MLKAVTFFLLPLLAFASPQYGGYGNAPGTTASTTSAAAAASVSGHVTVNVAPGGALTFSPANITAPAGTLVTFTFPSGGLAHSVSQSSFGAPCSLLAASGNSSAGFDSGLTTGTTYTLNVTDDTKPIWFFCKATGHCGSGMVGSINAPSTGNTFDSFLAAAKQIGSSEPVVSGSGALTGGVGAVATAGPTTGSPSSTGSAASPTKSKSGTMRLGPNTIVALLSGAASLVFAF